MPIFKFINKDNVIVEQYRESLFDDRPFAITQKDGITIEYKLFAILDDYKSNIDMLYVYKFLFLGEGSREDVVKRLLEGMPSKQDKIDILKKMFKNEEWTLGKINIFADDQSPPEVKDYSEKLKKRVSVFGDSKKNVKSKPKPKIRKLSGKSYEVCKKRDH